MNSIWKNIASWGACGCLVLGLSLGLGCETTGAGSGAGQPPVQANAAPVQAKPAVVSASGGDSPVVSSQAQGDKTDLVRVGEKLTIEFSDVGNPPAPIVQSVREDGSITLPFNQTVVAAGKKRGDLVVEIHKLFVPKYYRRLTVNIKTEDRFYYVGGHVKAPGRFPYIGDITALKAIQSAGDFDDYAKKTKVEINRADGTHSILDAKKAIKNPKLDVPIYPGDSINVPQRNW